MTCYIVIYSYGTVEWFVMWLYSCCKAKWFLNGDIYKAKLNEFFCIWLYSCGKVEWFLIWIYL